jgi:hypothetical protein
VLDSGGLALGDELEIEIEIEAISDRDTRAPHMVVVAEMQR